ncbi:ComEC/Rec2 family competence protein [Thermodesulfobacteriota bacterium]
MGSTTFLFSGDIMFPAEAELVSSAGAELKSTVLMAPHHGSRKSSSDLLLNAVRPAAVIISAGWKNRFRFPHPLILKKYQQRGYRIFRTDTNGAIVITTDGQDLNIKPYQVSSE